MAWTIFTVKTSDYIVLHSDNQAYWSTMERKFKQDLFTPDSPTEHSESGTPAPPPLPPLNILRFTTEHMPKDPGTGFVLGPIRTNATSSYITVGSQVSVVGNSPCHSAQILAYDPKKPFPSINTD